VNDLYFYKPGPRPERHVPLWAMITIIVLVVSLLVASACYVFLAPESVQVVPEKGLTPSAQAFNDHFYGIDVDVTGMDQAAIDEALLFCSLEGYDNIVISTQDPDNTDTLHYAIQTAYNQGMAPHLLFDIRPAAAGFAKGYDLPRVGNILKTVCSYPELSGIIFDGWDIFRPNGTFFEDLPYNYTMEDLCKIARYADADLFIGLYCEGEANAEKIPISWISANMFDYLLIDAGGFVTDQKNSFKTNVKAWEDLVGQYAETVYMLRSSRINSLYSGWNDPAQLLRQLIELNSDKGLQFCMDSYQAIKNDTTDASDRAKAFLDELADNNFVIKDLIFTSPSAQNSSTYSSVVVFAGASNPDVPLYMNGKEVERDKLGHFEENVTMDPGSNRIVFTHQDREFVFNVTYLQATLALVYPNDTQYYDSGSTVSVSAVAKKDSVVTATIGDQTVTLKQDSFYNESVDSFGEYYTYTGKITLPMLSADTDMGKIVFTATLNGETQTKEGGTIAVYRRKPQPKPQNPQNPQNPTPEFTLPEESGYINVGTGYIAEVIIDRAETFDGTDLNDFSQPTNSYLPKGTLDYCKSTADSLFNSDNERLNYRTLRYGKRVYESSDRNGKEIKVYEGTLPDTNNISLVSTVEGSRYTTMTFKTDWKAPFRLELGNQKYIDDSRGDERPYYTVDSVTYNYVDITFCYAEAANGNFNLSSDNPVFKSAEWIKNEADWTLRLHLRKAGSMCGWNAEYDSKGNLVFTFLHPAEISDADNVYGVSLEGVVIMLDPGHTGTAETGATHNLYGKNQKYNVTEAMANLTLSLEIKRQLESLGATVLLTREHNNLSSTLTLNDRIEMLAEKKPDIFISVHHNYNKYASAEGFSSFYFTPMSWRLADKIYKATANTGMYYDMRGNTWHTYFITRVTDCPVVLTENGFMSNDYEYQNIITDAAANQKRAAATVKGIVDYFKSIQ